MENRQFVEMELVAAQVSDVGVLRRMLFATSYLPSDVPHYWNIVATFCNQGSSIISPESAKMLMENVQILNAQAFCTDEELTRELIAMEYGPTKQPLGVPLIPSQSVFHVVESYYRGLIVQAGYLSILNLWVPCQLHITTSTVTITERAAMWFSSMDTTEIGINVCVTITG